MNRVIAAFFLLAVGCSSESNVSSNASRADQHSGTENRTSQYNGLNADPRIASWQVLDVKCHQLIADPKGPEACAQRDQAEIKLNQQGLCFGKKREEEYQYKWHKCGADSRRSGK